MLFKLLLYHFSSLHSVNHSNHNIYYILQLWRQNHNQQLNFAPTHR